MNNWQPSADISTLKLRANFLANIRQFFAKRNVMEVETPLLSNGTITDVHLDAFQTSFEHHNSGQPTTLYLQTSPEFAMKRLLAAGSGCIYQICKAFRNETAGRLHNPEFTMLEWYRVGFDERQLMDELDQLVQRLLGTAPAVLMSYQQAFLTYLSFDPLTVSLAELKTHIAKEHNDAWLQAETNKDTLLQWLFSMKIEPELGRAGEEYQPCFVYDFPSSQAALAKINQQDPRIAHRFELYFKGIELANGFYELQDANEQVARFDADNQLRQGLKLPTRAADQHFLAALESGLPDCAGVAVGIDRLFMLACQKKNLAEAMSFSIKNA